MYREHFDERFGELEDTLSTWAVVYSHNAKAQKPMEVVKQNDE